MAVLMMSSILISGGYSFQIKQGVTKRWAQEKHLHIDISQSIALICFIRAPFRPSER